jgi:uncharacterized protein YprB with RNaseH-like and TPR domain
VSLSDRIREVVGQQSAVDSRQSTLGVESRIPNPESRRDLSCLGGAWHDQVFVVERRYDRDARHGRDTVGAIADRLAAASQHATWFAGGAPAAAPFVFFDLETTGLSGGAGTQAFLVGCATFETGGAFVVRQFLLTSPADEKPMLGRVRDLLSGAGALVSFNGKSFDAPVLETRYLFHRMTWDGARIPHVDVLHPARRFWQFDDCSLVTLERHIVGSRRVGDVPGFEVPGRYFQFVRTRNARPLVPVLEHNRLDLLTLAALASRLLYLARSGPAEASTAREALALGQVFARAGLEPQAREAFERALTLCAAPVGAYDATRIEALRALALAWRRVRQFDAAAQCWSDVLTVRGCPAAVAREATEALAIHNEHRVRDLVTARTFALRGLEEGLAPAPARLSWTRAVRHRLERIERKLTDGRASSESSSLLS